MPCPWSGLRISASPELLVDTAILAECFTHWLHFRGPRHAGECFNSNAKQVHRLSYLEYMAGMLVGEQHNNRDHFVSSNNLADVVMSSMGLALLYFQACVTQYSPL